MGAGTQDIAAQLAELKELISPKPEQQAQPSSFTLKLGGNEYTVRDGAEAQRLVDQFEVQQREELERQRIALESQQQYQQQLPQQQRTGDAFNKEEFAKLFLDDPRKASRYAMQNDPEMLAVFQGLAAEIAAVKQANLELKQESATARFLDQHRSDYVPTAENFRAIESIMKANNLPWESTDALNLAFFTAKQQGLLSGPAQTAGSATEQADDAEEFAQRQAAPPRIKRRGNQEASDEAEVLATFEQLPAEKMKEYLMKLKGER